MVLSKAVKLAFSEASTAVSAAGLTSSMPLGPSTVWTQSPDGAWPASTMMKIERRSRTACSGVNGPYGVSDDRRAMVKPVRPKLSTRPPSSSLT